MQLTTPDLIGRDAELAVLDTVLDRVRKRHGNSVFLVGEAGIGKSRLAREVVGRAVGAGMPVLRGRSSVLGATVPFRPLTEALLGLVRAGETPDHPELAPYRPAL